MIDILIQLGIGLGAALIISAVLRWILLRTNFVKGLELPDQSLITRSISILIVVSSVILVIAGQDEAIRRDLVEGLVGFMPRAVVGVGIFIVALVLGRVGGVLVMTAMRERSPAMASRLRTVVVAAAIVLGLLMALDQMGVETGTLIMILAIVLGGASLGTALALGLGSLPLTRQISAGRHVEDRFTSGQRIEAGDLVGRIVSMGLTSVQIIGEDGRRWEVPHTLLLESPVRVEDDEAS